jgi:tRNA(fMet)-specific endonuclease VapC
MTEPRFLLDTNICIYVIRALGERLRNRLAEQDVGSLAISAVSLAELEVGLRPRPEQQRRFEDFVTELHILPFDGQAARAYGRLPFQRDRYDHLIAAHALSLDLTLVTNNEADFTTIPGLRIENWTR